MNIKKLGLILTPSVKIPWMSTHCGPSFAEVVGDNIHVYMQGRDCFNISRIGKIILNSNFQVLDIVNQPLLENGEVGCFDESGVAYPWIVNNEAGLSYLYYVGWVKGGLGGFQNYIGLAKSGNNKSFKRVHRVPIIERDDIEPFGSGSVAVMKDNLIYKMWYTSFDRWEREDDNSIKHYYHIKYAESIDGISWKRNNQVCITFENDKEYAIAKPCVIKENDIYKMWYTYRGLYYKIGYAESKDGISWIRMDNKIKFDRSVQGWDSEMVAYGFVFDFKEERYMLYNGNGYGKSGLGLAKIFE